MLPNHGKMPRKTGGGATETSGKGKGGAAPHPNGGETRPCAVDGGKMKRRMKDTPITHTPLSVGAITGDHRGDVDTNQHMPRSTGGGEVRLPTKR